MRPEHRGHRENKVRKAPLEFQGRRAKMERIVLSPAHKGRPGLKALKGRREPLVRRVHKVHLVYQVKTAKTVKIASFRGL